MKRRPLSGKTKTPFSMVTFAIFLYFSGCMHSQTANAQMRAGTGKSNITADCGDVHDSLYVKALVMETKNTRIAIITMDVIAIGTIGDIPDDFLIKVRKKLQDEMNINGKNVLINASHNHLDGFLNGGGKISGDVEGLTLLAVKKALMNMEKVKVGTGSGFENRFAMNRRIRLNNGEVFTIRHANPNVPDNEMKQLGDIDPEIGILRIDRLDGTPKALVYNYACHPYTGVPDKKVTAEFPGFASGMIEDQLGHGAMAFFIQGAAGDITEILYKDTNSPRDCRPFGQMLALSTLKAFEKVPTFKTGLLKCIADTLELPLRTDIPDRLVFLDEEEKRLLSSLRSTSLNLKAFIPMFIKYSLSPDFPSYYAYRYLHEEKLGMEGLNKMDEANRKDMVKYAGNIYAMEKLAQIVEEKEMLKLKQSEIKESGGKFVRAEIVGLRIGDFILVTFPGEAFARVGLNIKAESPYKETFFAGYSNGYVHYAPPSENYEEWGYEVTNCILSPEWQDIYEKKIIDIIHRL